MIPLTTHFLKKKLHPLKFLYLDYQSNQQTMKKLLLLFIVLAAACTNNKHTELLTADERYTQHVANTTIIRDDFGVPHIYGKTDANAVFGLLYAQCEDDFNRVERNYVWATGRLAEWEGEAALYSDLRAKLYMTQEEAIDHYNKSPKWLQDLCMAFADGINYYLKTHPEVQPKVISHFEPWMPMYFSEGSIGGDIESVSTRSIKAFYDGQASKNLAIHHGYTSPTEAEPRGSNGFALSGSRTASGNAMLLINPHTSFFFRGEVHVVSEEGLNAYGAVTWGQFFVYQGFNDKTGWMHPSTGVDMIDQFEESILKNDDKIQYKYGEELRDVESIPITLSYKTPEGIKERSFTGYRTHHGPITHKSEKGWVATKIMWDPIKALEQSYKRTKNSNHEEFYSMMNIRTNSSNNTLYADADGNIAYYHGNFIPKRNVKYDYSKPVDGSNPDTDWQGIHDLKDNIYLFNPDNGWIQNCNSTPFTAAGTNSPKKEDYPYYMATFPENYRGMAAIPLLEKAENVTLESLIEMAYDPYLPGADHIISGLIAAYDEHPEKHQSVKAEMDLLKVWDFRTSETSKAMSLAHYYLQAYNKSDFLAGTGYMGRLENLAEGISNEARMEIFKQALELLKEDFGTTQIEWAEINRYQRINGDIYQQFDDAQPSIGIGFTSATWGALASYRTRRNAGAKKWYGTVGNSFVAVVEFGEKVKAKSLLAGGQSGDPDSPHFGDQAALYKNVRFKDVAFYKDDVLKRAKRTYKPGE